MTLRALRESDAELFARAFDEIGWNKPANLFLRYFAAQQAGLRWVRVADVAGVPAGYVTLVWRSDDPVFSATGIPEIVDLNVLPAYRRKGIATALLDAAEAEAASRSETVGIRVGLHGGYGAAQRLYVRRSYIPDGKGVVVRGESISEGATAPIDDDLTLRLSKDLSPKS